MKMKWTDNLDSSIYQDALKIRYQVFVNEQNVPEALEVDELEPLSHYGVIYQDGQAIATVRLYSPKAKQYKVQRVAVLKEFRKQGIGRYLMEEVEKEAKRQGFSQLILDSQNQAIPFYEKLNYQIVGDEFLDAGIPHHRMIKNIK